MSLTSNFAPSLLPAGVCSLSDPDVAWLHLISDVAIGLAYFSIPAVLTVFVMRRRDLAYPWIFGLFALFIIACGSTHFMHAWAMFRPDAETEAMIKALTAAISVATAVVLWPLLPRLLALPSPQALAREVEERRAAEGRAVASEARIAAFINHLAEALFVVRVGAADQSEGAFVIETVNPAFERLFGIPAAGIEGQGHDQGLPESIRQVVLPNWRQAAEGGVPVEYTAEAETPAGFRIWQTVLVPMIDAEGRVERLLGSSRDITTTRRLQSELVQSARLATVGTMCAGLAHETSQPLNSALLWLRSAGHAARELAPPETLGKIRRAIGVVEDQLRRAGDLVARIRSLAGDEAGATQTFDVGRVVADVVQTAASQYGGEGILVRLHAAGRALPVHGVAGRLEQALLNLLANARDAIQDRRGGEPEAAAEIIVTLREAAGQAVVEVRDTGPGIPAALRDAIFDPFFTTREPGRGSGLGLPLAAAVARAMGGHIEATNAAEGGAVLTMRLDLLRPPEPQQRKAGADDAGLPGLPAAVPV